MLNTDNYNKYKKIKQLLSFKIDDIDFNQVLGSDIIRIVYYPETIAIKSALGKFFYSYNFSSLLNAFASNKVVITSSTVAGRKEYIEQIDLTAKCFESAIYLPLDTTKVVFTFNPFYVVKAFLFVNRALTNVVDFKQKFFIASCLSFGINNFNTLNKTFKDFTFRDNRYIAFHSSFSLESIISLFLNKRNVSTFTLTHGMSYVSYRKFIPADILAGDNVSAKFILAWGNTGKEDLIHNFSTPEDRIKVSGNLKYPAKQISISTNFKTCLVLLGRHVYHESNLEILNILSGVKQQNQAINFVVKLHPFSAIENYSQLCEQFGFQITKDNLLDSINNFKCDFAVVNNSTIYYEVMYYGLICFRYQPSENEIFDGMDDYFDSVPTFFNKIQYFSRYSSKDLNLEVTNILVNNLGMGINKYAEAVLQ